MPRAGGPPYFGNIFNLDYNYIHIPNNCDVTDAILSKIKILKKHYQCYHVTIVILTKVFKWATLCSSSGAIFFYFFSYVTPKSNLDIFVWTFKNLRYPLHKFYKLHIDIDTTATLI